MSNIRQAFENLKGTPKYEALDDHVKSELERAVTSFEFTIQTEFEPCKEFVLELMNSKGIEDIESMVNSEDLGMMLRTVIENTASIYRMLLMGITTTLFQVATYEQTHRNDMGAIMDTLAESTRLIAVTDYVVGEVVGKSIADGAFKFGVAGQDDLLDFFANPDAYMVNPDEPEGRA